MTMEDSDRIQGLLGILTFENMPKAVKKRALMEACRILGLKFSMEELEAIEAKFSAMEEEANEAAKCPFCDRRIPLYARFALSRHLTECPTLMRRFGRRPTRSTAKRTSGRKSKKRRRSGRS